MTLLGFLLLFWSFVFISSAIFGCKVRIDKNGFEFTWGLFYYFKRKYKEKSEE